jgi:DNA-binding MarR family transcriptional regulator
MDAYLTGSTDVRYSDAAPILIAGTSDEALGSAASFLEASGARIGGRVPIDVAPRRIEEQVCSSAIWIEVDRDCGPALDVLIEQVNRDVRDGRYGAVLSIRSELIDRIYAEVDEPDIEILIDGDEAERAAALAIALSSPRRPMRLSDVAADKNAQRIRQLSEEVGRIASTLARLSEGPAAPAQRPAVAEGGDAPAVSAETVRAVIRARRLRSRYFPEELFADPAWDMLLDLLQAEIAHLRVPVSSLCIAAAVPATTALRWLKTMVQQGVFVRRADPHDGRRVFVELAPKASHAMRCYFAEIDPAAAVI